MSSSTNNVFNCKNENWLFNSAYQWTLSPRSSGEYVVFNVFPDGDVNSNYYTYYTFGVHPALFLKSDVVIAGGTGESVENAYTLE